MSQSHDNIPQAFFLRYCILQAIKTGGVEGLGARLVHPLPIPESAVMSSVLQYSLVFSIVRVTIWSHKFVSQSF